MRDVIRLVDGPLEGRLFSTDRTVSTPLDLHAAVSPDGRVLAFEGEPAPRPPFVPAEYRYAPVMAPDGVQSRGDDGALRFYLVEEVRP